MSLAIRKPAQYHIVGESVKIENNELKKAKALFKNEIELLPTNSNANEISSSEKNEKNIINFMKNPGYIVVEKSKDHVSKDDIDKTYNNRMINNHEENSSININSKESWAHKMQDC